MENLHVVHNLRPSISSVERVFTKYAFVCYVRVKRCCDIEILSVFRCSEISKWRCHSWDEYFIQHNFWLNSAVKLLEIIHKSTLRWFPNQALLWISVRKWNIDRVVHYRFLQWNGNKITDYCCIDKKSFSFVHKNVTIEYIMLTWGYFVEIFWILLLMI